jgi:hypothetical protein
MIPSQAKRLKPEFARVVLALNVNVRRLIAIETRKEESIRPWNSLDSGHLEMPNAISSA